MISVLAGRGGIDPELEPYRSVLRSISAQGQTSLFGNIAEDPSAREERIGSRLPPWRRPIGRAFFLLNSEFARLYGENISDGEKEEYAELTERIFKNFSDESIGFDQELEECDGLRSKGRVGGWTIDERPMRGWAEGESEVRYADAPVSSTSRYRQLCWNCRQLGHAFNACPLPRNQLQIQTSRNDFNHAREAMPEYAIAYLPIPSSSVAEKARQLELLDRFRPGHVSEDLAEAVWWIGDEVEDDEEEIQQIKVRRRRREWPWLWWMLKWGYPPGWLAGRDPLGVVRRRILVEPEAVLDLGLDDDDDVLKIYGGELASSLNTPTLTRLTSPKVHPRIDISHTSPAASDMSLESEVPFLTLPQRDLPPTPPADITPTPPPPLASPPPLLTSPAQHHVATRQSSPPNQQYPTVIRRWAKYHTDLFDSDRLMAYSTAKPLPLGS